MAFGKATKALLRDRARGHRHRLRPQVRHHAAVRHDRRPRRLEGARSPIPVGSWAGKSADDAEQALKARGLKVDVSHAVLHQRRPRASSSPRTPKGGTLFKGDTVSLLVSLGPQLVEVPNVVAAGVDDATAALQAAGFVVETQEAPGYIGLGYVFSMDPAAGTELPIGSTVTLYLRRDARS